MHVLAIILILFIIFLSVLVSLLPYFYAKTELVRKKNTDEKKKPSSNYN